MGNYIETTKESKIPNNIEPSVVLAIRKIPFTSNQLFSLYRCAREYNRRYIICQKYPPETMINEIKKLKAGVYRYS